MLASGNGRDEAAAKNNHGTYYDVQTVSFALFLGKLGLWLKKYWMPPSKNASPVQIEPRLDASLWNWLRTKAWGYSTGNLDGLMLLARLGENVDVDLWNYQNQRWSLYSSAGAEYLYPFAVGGKVDGPATRRMAAADAVPA